MEDIELQTQAEKEAEYKRYGKPVAARIPVDLHRQIGNEAVLRGTSISDYAGTLLMDAHKEHHKANTEINLLLKKIQLLERQLSEQHTEFGLYSEFERHEFAKLKANCDLLRKLYRGGHQVTQIQLTDMGFDFALATRTAIKDDRQYIIVLDMCYRVEGTSIHIKPINS